jgi:hypothetical protein
VEQNFAHFNTTNELAHTIALKDNTAQKENEVFQTSPAVLNDI